MTDKAEPNQEEPTESALAPAAAQTWATVVDKALVVASDSPDLRAAGHSLGKSARTVAQTIEVCLLPLAAFNSGVAKARAYFETRFRQNLETHTQDIPPESVRDPAPAVAAQALQGLAFAHDERDLENMYLALLATSMDGRTPKNAAHPAFVEVIRQLTGEEANLLKVFLTVPKGPIAQIRTQMPSTDNLGIVPGPQSTLTRYLTPINDDGKPVEIHGLGAMIDNWIRLGLIEVDFSRSLSAPDAYAWADERPEFVRARELHQKETKKVVITPGILTVTEFGERFALAVGIGP